MRLLNDQVWPWQNISSWMRVSNDVWRECSIGQRCKKAAAQRRYDKLNHTQSSAGKEETIASNSPQEHRDYLE